jgi:hypothetical protein
MQDPTTITQTPPPVRRVVPTPGEFAQQLQRNHELRTARLAYADAKVAKSARRLMDDLPLPVRRAVAAQHGTNLLRRAVLRAEYGAATDADRRLIARNAAVTSAVYGWTAR